MHITSCMVGVNNNNCSLIMLIPVLKVSYNGFRNFIFTFFEEHGFYETKHHEPGLIFAFLPQSLATRD